MRAGWSQRPSRFEIIVRGPACGRRKDRPAGLSQGATRRHSAAQCGQVKKDEDWLSSRVRGLTKVSKATNDVTVFFDVA
jgi:hypothetical protein